MVTEKIKKRIKIISVILIMAGILGGFYIYYLFNMPHIDVQAQEADYTLESSSLVKEYLSDEKKANAKFLDTEGDSKILIVNGTIKSLGTDMNNQRTVLLKENGDLAGVNCVFMATSNDNAASLEVGQNVSIKGIIRSGASYDSDLELYENILLEKCDVITH